MTARPDGRSLAVLALCFASAALVLGTLPVTLRNLSAQMRRRGRTPTEIAGARPGVAARMGGFLIIGAVVVTSSAGWTWGSVFYGISALFLLYLLFLYRSYVKAASEGTEA